MKTRTEMQEATAPEQNQSPHVLRGIQQVMSAFAENGIAKNRKNESQGFKFRGIDDVMNRMAQHLVEANLVIVPQVTNRDVQERVNSRGNPLFYVTVQVNFQIFSTVDGSSLICSVPGEAMDSGDKATNKALSIAYKYMAFQLFAIPIDEDPDATTHQLAKATPAPAPKTLTADEQVIITNLCEQAGFSLEKICQIYGVGKIDEIPQSKLSEVTTKLQQKIKSTKVKEEA
jgi:hypothetical protein